MTFCSEFKNNIHLITHENFENSALEVFRYQAEHNSVYKEYLTLLSTNVSEVDCLEKIPFLPIQFFKSHEIKSNQERPVFEFLSSGTTGMVRSRHLVFDMAFYLETALKAFELLFSRIEEFEIWGLLPNYQENTGSSLIKMVEFFVERSKNGGSGFYSLEEVQKRLTDAESLNSDKKILLIGVSFALLDLAESNITVADEIADKLIVMETGGMKGRKKEMIRGELHAKIGKGLNVSKVYSEYGMTELLSQGYSMGDGIFVSPPWLKILTREVNDPMHIKRSGKGGVNVIDLANIDTCSFIATQDLGQIHPDGTFEIIGRFDHSDVRGCNLMSL